MSVCGARGSSAETKGGLDPYLLKEKGKRRVSPLSAGFCSRQRAGKCAVEGALSLTGSCLVVMCDK